MTIDTVLEIELASVLDESIPTRAGTMARYKKYTFWLGKFGPFVERIPVENTDPNEFNNRVAALRAALIRQQQ